MRDLLPGRHRGLRRHVPRRPGGGRPPLAPEGQTVNAPLRILTGEDEFAFWLLRHGDPLSDLEALSPGEVWCISAGIMRRGLREMGFSPGASSHAAIVHAAEFIACAFEPEGEERRLHEPVRVWDDDLDFVNYECIGTPGFVCPLVWTDEEGERFPGALALTRALLLTALAEVAGRAARKAGAR